MYDISDKRKIDKRDKGKRRKCSIEEHSFEDEGDNYANEETLFMAIKKDNKENASKLKVKVSALHAKLEPVVQIIVSRCLNHMTKVEGKFIHLEKYDGGSMRFTREEVASICGR